MTGTPKLTREYVASLLDYDPISGIFTWRWREGLRRAVNVREAGTPAGTMKDGYIVIMIDGRQLRAHRLAHLLVTGEWPINDMDHRDLNRANNAWINIRPATRSQNHGNKPRYATNTSGHKGVDWHRATGKWRARLQVESLAIHLGLFHTVEAAAKAYAKAATKHFGEFARFD